MTAGPSLVPAGNDVQGDSAGEVSHGYIRGSALLLGGRFVSLALNFAVQVLIVRHLSKSDYGAFAYAMGVVSMTSSVVLLGMEKTIPRFLPIYQAKEDHGKVLGAIILPILTILGLGGALFVSIHGLRGALLGTAVNDPLALTLLLILIAMAPVQALDSLMQSLLAIFVGAGALFLRRHVVGPGIKLVAILLVMAVSGDAQLLAWAYLIGGVVGVAVFVAVLVGALRQQGVLRRALSAGVSFPAGEIFRHGLPLLSHEALLIIRTSGTLILLEYLRSTVDVADYRAVLPVARLNLVALESFSLLFIPTAARLFARGDRLGLNDLYWRTSGWIVTLTFPVLAMTFILAAPISGFLFGVEYVESASVLSILAVGLFFHAALGFNAYTLRVQNRVRQLVLNDLVAAATTLVLLFLLIPRFGAPGAAVATASSYVTQNILNQLVLSRSDSGIRAFDRPYMGILALVVLGIGTLLGLHWITGGMVMPTLFATLLVSFAIIRLTRHVTRVGDAFPALLRVPGLGWLIT